jgi:hypothetical protein
MRALAIIFVCAGKSGLRISIVRRDWDPLYILYWVLLCCYHIRTSVGLLGQKYMDGLGSGSHIIWLLELFF